MKLLIVLIAIIFAVALTQVDAGNKKKAAKNKEFDPSSIMTTVGPILDGFLPGASDCLKWIAGNFKNIGSSSFMNDAMKNCQPVVDAAKKFLKDKVPALGMFL